MTPDSRASARTPRPVLELLGRAVMDKNRFQREARRRQVELDAAREEAAELRDRLRRFEERAA